MMASGEFDLTASSCSCQACLGSDSPRPPKSNDAVDTASNDDSSVSLENTLMLSVEAWFSCRTVSSTRIDLFSWSPGPSLRISLVLR